MSHTPRTSLFRRFWKPAAVSGASGTAVAVWFEEILLYAEDILTIVFLPILAGLIYLFNNFIFKSRHPRHEDLGQTGDKK